MQDYKYLRPTWGGTDLITCHGGDEEHDAGKFVLYQNGFRKVCVEYSTKDGTPKVDIRSLDRPFRHPVSKPRMAGVASESDFHLEKDVVY